jgi:uncharacterized metal-binding protein YceD (DUF177 family)
VGKKSEYVIGFTGLPDGQHLFSFKIGKSFFEQLDYSEIKDASLDVKLVLQKKPTLMMADFEIKGKVKVMCDSCTDDFFLPVKGTASLVYKFGEEDMDDESVVTVYPNETEINISQPVYEFTTLLLPARRIHPKGKCNPEMTGDIDRYLMVEAPKKGKSTPKDTGTGKAAPKDEDIDPRWAALKKLRK